jgi:uncharacterized membrane protein YhaH (DUF805 family)
MTETTSNNSEQVSSPMGSPRIRIAVSLPLYVLTIAGIVWYTVYTDGWSLRNRVLYFAGFFTAIFLAGYIARHFASRKAASNDPETTVERLLYSLFLVSLVCSHSAVRAYRRHDTSEFVFECVLFVILVLVLFDTPTLTTGGPSGRTDSAGK